LISPLATSSAVVCSDRKASPMPAITACLIVSLLRISIANTGSIRCDWK